MSDTDDKPRGLPERYRLLGVLGSGAMGVVWEAEDTTLDRRVALKVLRPDADVDTNYRARLQREARVLSQIRHPNVITVYDFGEAGTELYLALDIVRGTDARHWLAAAPRTPTEILAMWCQVARGLAAVHAAGIVHRDVKPENVLVANDGRAVITDFGLARAPGEVPLTQEGFVVGTPLYMAVEILHGKPATALSDQFAWCLCVWEALTGTRPFPTRPNLAAQAFAMLEVPPPPDGTDQRVMRVLTRGLNAVPALRWPDVASLVAALERPWWARLLRR